MQNNILIIDDDIELCQLLKKCVEKESLTADFAHTGTDGLSRLAQESYHLIVLDVMLPGIDGFQVLSKIREMSTVPVLMLTARIASVDKVNGLRSGADDYLTKPFDVEEFIARVLSLIRRYTTLNNSLSEEPKQLSFQNLTIDLDTRIVYIGNGQVELHPKEFDIFCYLAKNQGRILTKQQIYEEIWQEPYAYDDNNIMGYISKLRKQIEPDTNKPVYIQTVKGVGYRFSREV
ncbi:response regulator transcription factor (plasmid) [Clostridium estertheticum]|uniref:Response regulator transcription factor n=1 Tax=Clostridium estertheticum TaxID=238834 RepID=A0AA47I9M2_9CLOT|nr:response regulator transcription factor [Clostridium estertheticum]MBU3157722.1 response regulator transcription factor [Clostridium estertheticum]MBU3201973.1 response regulator transcription factor [Clostridium estertheticum]WAG63350.1 response regulator transcription factor [Clostridium estertheticum]WAG68220.1 response regulator transcription factor [Clostridium estertheticum]